MTISIQTPIASPPPTAGVTTAQETTDGRSAWRWVWIPLVVLLIFIGAYALAWTNAKQLTERFVRDADASYNAGKFTDALVGYQQFDQQTNQYVNYGGYLAVEKI